MFHGRMSLKLMLLLWLVNFVSGFRLEMMCIFLIVSVKPHSSPWFSAACTAAIVHRNYFFCLYQQNKSSESNESSDRLEIVAKGFLKQPKLHMLLNQKSLSLPRNFVLRTFGKLLIMFSTKVNLLYLYLEL